TPLPRSLEESCASWLLLGDRGVVGGAHSIMGAIGGKADYAKGAALKGGGTSKGTREGKGAGGEAV
ncbi:unnamed protein product, partial [Ectocarpus fasciculatus]